MINVGIVGGETEAAGELIRILLNHPDVILRAVCSPSHAGQRLEGFHRGLTGDTDLCFVKTLDPSKLNCVFLVGESWEAEEFMATVKDAPSHRNDADEDDAEDLLRIIDMTGSYHDGEHGMVYGFPEFHRKALVRGALRASIPSAIATGVELSLFPLAKNHLLSGTTHATVSMSRNQPTCTSAQETAAGSVDKAFGIPSYDIASSQLSTRLDPVAPVANRPDTERAATEIEDEIRRIDPSFSGALKLRMAAGGGHLRGMTVVTDITCGGSVEEIRHLYEEAYSDHAFTYLVDREPEVADVSNTNKCLLNIIPLDGGAAPSAAPAIRIKAVLDDYVKGSSGTAVHCMNLLFGLSERTGLALKASVV